MKELKNSVIEITKTVSLAFVLALSIRATVAEARFIPSESMVPTLLVDDKLMIEKISGYTDSFSRGDIVVFYPPYIQPRDDSFKNVFMRKIGLTSDTPLIKRVIGLPGETIEIKDNTVYINGKALNEKDYTSEGPAYNMPALKIPADEVFVMGDNRNNSFDSHSWGTLPVKNIIGEAVFRFWPMERISTFTK